MSNFSGLYFGVDFIDLVSLSNVRGDFKVVKTNRVYLYDEDTAPQEKERGAAILAALKKLLNEERAGIGLVNFAVPQDEVMVRRFTMPYLFESERAAAVKFEAQKYLPFKVDDIISDFFITGESVQEKSMDALFVAVNKPGIEKHVNSFRDLGIKLGVVDIAPIALLRLFSVIGKLAKGKTQVVVYMEKDIRGSVIIVQDESAYLAREVARSASKAIFFENVLSNIRLSVDYFKRETKEAGISGVIICGDGDLSGARAYLQENIGSSTAVDIFTLTNEIGGVSDLSRKQLIAIGLAMASWEKPRPKINLLTQLPKSMAPQEIISEYKHVIIEAVALVLILMVLQLAGNARTSFLRKKLNVLEGQKAMALKGLAPAASKEALRDIELKIESQIKFFEDFAGSKKVLLTKKLSSLGSFLPVGAWIESFDFVDEIDKVRKLDMKGMVYSKDKNEANLVDKMLIDMKNSKDFYFGFDDIKFGSLEKVSAYDKEILAFSVECTGQPLKAGDFFMKDNSTQRALSGTLGFGGEGTILNTRRK